ncbi:hypothetical protein ACF0H5_005619 [Mactra antiquata]
MAASMRCRLRMISRSISISDKRPLSCGHIVLKDFNHSKTMQKLLRKTQRQQKKSVDTPIYGQNVETMYSFRGPMRSKRQFSEGMKRRAMYLSEIFYEAVSQIISNGDLDVLVTVSKVEVIPDMSHMNIYWRATGNRDKDLQTQKELDAKAKTLRHILMQNKVCGNVPRPWFIADSQTARVEKVFDILRTIEVETHNEEINSDKSDAEDIVYDSDLDVPRRKDFRRINSELEQSENDDIDDIIDLNNPHRQNMYGLPHDSLMKKIINIKSTATKRPLVTPQMDSSVPFYPSINLKQAKKYFKVKKERNRRQMIEDWNNDVNDSVVDELEERLQEEREITLDNDDDSIIDRYVKSLEQYEEDDDERKF